MQEYSFVFLGGVTIYFWCGSLSICCLFLQSRLVLQDAQCVFKEKEAMGRASSQCLVTGFSTAARTCRKVAQASPSCRALGCGNEL